MPKRTAFGFQVVCIFLRCTLKHLQTYTNTFSQTRPKDRNPQSRVPKRGRRLFVASWLRRMGRFSRTRKPRTTPFHEKDTSATCASPTCRMTNPPSHCQNCYPRNRLVCRQRECRQIIHVCFSPDDPHCSRLAHRSMSCTVPCMNLEFFSF